MDNRCEEDPGKSVWQILAENFFSLFNLLNFALAFCLLLVGSYRNMMFLGVVFSNTFIGTFQELRARKTLRRLKLLNAPTACVLRDGKERSCRSEELVQGDLVIARAGDQVLADGEMISGGGTVNESLLTGESDPISKKPGDELFSGSYLMEGRIVYHLTRVGEASYASRLLKEAKAIKPPKSVLMTDLNKLVRLVEHPPLPAGPPAFSQAVFPDPRAAGNGDPHHRCRHDRHDPRRVDPADQRRAGGGRGALGRKRGRWYRSSTALRRWRVWIPSVWTKQAP